MDDEVGWDLATCAEHIDTRMEQAKQNKTIGFIADIFQDFKLFILKNDYIFRHLRHRFIYLM